MNNLFLERFICTVLSLFTDQVQVDFEIGFQKLKPVRREGIFRFSQMSRLQCNFQETASKNI